MAKSPANKLPAPPVATPAAAPAPSSNGIVIQVGGPPPARTRVGFGKEPSPYKQTMLDMPAPEGDSYAYFDVAATTEVTDPAERIKSLKEDARKISNRLSSVARRVSKEDPTAKFAFYTLEENDGVVVRVYRVEAEPAVA